MSTIRELIDAFPHQVCRLRPGQQVMRQGGEADSLYVVLSGELQVWIEHPDRAERVDTLGAGDVIGEAELLEPGPATATVYAPAGAWVARVRHAELARMWQESPALARELHGRALIGLMGRLRGANCEHEARLAQQPNSEVASWTRAAC